MSKTLTHKETGDKITVTITSDGVKNTVLLITGTIESTDDSQFKVIDLSRMSGTPSTIKLDGAVYMVESGLKVLLKYKDQPYVIPLEGKSKVDFGWVGGVLGHDAVLVCKGVGSFFIVLDLSKMGV